MPTVKRPCAIEGVAYLVSTQTVCMLVDAHDNMLYFIANTGNFLLVPYYAQTAAIHICSLPAVSNLYIHCGIPAALETRQYDSSITWCEYVQQG